MTVFVVQFSSMDGPSEVVGVFATLECAKKAGSKALYINSGDKDNYGRDVDIVQTVLDDATSAPQFVQSFSYRDGSVALA